jgi:hypothetical protein
MSENFSKPLSLIVRHLPAAIIRMAVDELVFHLLSNTGLARPMHCVALIVCVLIELILVNSGNQINRSHR